MPNSHYRKFDISSAYIDYALNRSYYEHDQCYNSNNYHERTTKTNKLKCNIIYYKTLKMFIDNWCSDDDIRFILDSL